MRFGCGRCLIGMKAGGGSAMTVADGATRKPPAAAVAATLSTAALATLAAFPVIQCAWWYCY
jgi:hypothetical protein